jgi:hypothetical protein
MSQPDLQRHTIIVLWVTIVVSAVAVPALWVAFDVWSSPPPRCTAREVLLDVDQATWRLTAQRGLFFISREGEPQIRLDYRGLPTICGAESEAPVRLAEFGMRAEALRDFIDVDAQAFGGLKDVDLIVVGGRTRLDALPHSERGETFGPPLFDRPTIISCKPFRDFSGREFPWCSLSGWAPGGVPVFMRYEDAGDEEGRVRAVENVLRSLRR